MNTSALKPGYLFFDGQKYKTTSSQIGPVGPTGATGTTGATGATGPVTYQQIDTISLLKSFPIPSDNETVLVKGYYSPYDGGGGNFYWNNSSIIADNGGTIIASNIQGTGRWIRVFSGAISVRWFGAKGDKITDDTLSIQSAINYVSNVIIANSYGGGGSIYLPTGTYTISSPININSYNIHIYGEGMASSIFNPTGSFTVIYIGIGSPHPIGSTILESFGIFFNNIISGASATTSIGIDFSNSSGGICKNIHIFQNGGSPLTGLKMQGDATGNSPYYNLIDNYFFDGGGAGTSSVGIDMPAPLASFCGANANKITGGHIASCDYAIRCIGGIANIFDSIVTENIFLDHYYFGYSSFSNIVRTGYYEGISSSYLVRFDGYSGGNTIFYPDRRPLVAAIINPVSIIASNSIMQDAGINVNTGIPIVLESTQEILLNSEQINISSGNYGIKFDTTSVISSGYPNFNFYPGFYAAITHSPQTSDIAPNNFTITSSGPYLSATINKSPGNLILNTPAPLNGGIPGKISLCVSGYEIANINISAITSNGCIRSPYYALVGGTASSITTHSGDGGSISFDAGSCDQSGTIIITAGSSASSSGSIQLTFGTAFYQNGITVMLDFVNGTGSWNASANKIITAQGNTGFTLSWTNGGVALTNTSTYKINYFVIPR